MQGVGDSAQGFANCVLFVFLVPSVRERYLRAVCGCGGRYQARSVTTTELDDAVQRRHRDASTSCDPQLFT